LSTKVSRRYELPTCLLEVWTERSPLSEWQSQIVAQNLRFRLQLPSSKKIIKGNQQQITNLIESITSYCDRWLAQDDFDSLDHAIAVPQLSKIKLSTLQLFDLYESLELCANEFVILPNVLLEVRRITPNWLKIMAAAIAIVGVSIGTIRLISHEQPSYQVASTPAASAPEIAPKIVTESAPQKSAIAPSASLDNKSERNQKSDSGINSRIDSRVTDSLKSPKQISPPTNPSELKENSTARTSQADQGFNQVAKSRERTDKVAIAPEPIITGRVNTEQTTPTDQKSGNSPVQQSPRLESSSKDTSPMGAIAESAKPAAPSAKIVAPSTTSRAADSITTKIKVLQIQSELPSDITTDLVRYIQSQRITRFDSGTIALELNISGDRISNISIQNQNSTLKDATAIAELEKVILKWRSASSVTGKIYLVLQL
jgi:hypothetical protein